MVARLGLLILTAAACFFGGRALFAHELASAEPGRLSLPPLSQEGRRDLALTRAEGQVEKGTAEDGFVPAARGASLAEGQTLRVGGDARATLRLGVASSLVLEPGSEITALASAPGELALRLDVGRARASFVHPGRLLRLTSPDGGEVLARGTAHTRFLVAVHPGRLALLNEPEGSPVRLHAADVEVEVPPSRVSWSVHGGAPRPPIEPPREPGLELSGAVNALLPSPQAEGAPGAEPRVTITGRAHPLALVRVGAVVVDVRTDGTFEVHLPRQEEPYAVLASLPTGSEALLELQPPPPLVEEPPPPEPARKKRPKRRRPRRR